MNRALRKVSTYFVPKGTWDMTFSDAVPVSSPAFHNAKLLLLKSTLA